MKFYFLTYFTIFISSLSWAQLAIVQDPEGRTQIRDAMSNQSPIIDELSNGNIIFIYLDQENESWYSITYNKLNEVKVGYIHASRVRKLEKLTPFKEDIEKSNFIKFSHAQKTFTITTQKFSKKPVNLQGQELVEIPEVWGVELQQPNTEYKEITYSDENNKIVFPRQSINTLYNPNIPNHAAYWNEQNQKAYLIALNSDAAAAYYAVWIISEDGQIQRELIRPF